MRKGKQVRVIPMPSLNAEFSMEMLGEAVRSKRTEKRWRIDDLANKSGLSRKTVMKVEGGDDNVNFANLLHILDVVGLSLRIVDLKQLTNRADQNNEQIKRSVNHEDGWYE